MRFLGIAVLAASIDCTPSSPCEFEAWYPDADGDGHGAPGADPYYACESNLPSGGWSLTSDDCNDELDSTNPGAPELCDVDSDRAGIDNDCDGEVNEVCACDPSGNGDDCSDNNACNGIETCSDDYMCVAGTAPNCDDTMPATNDSCVPSAGCAHLGFAGMTDTTVRGNDSGGTLYPDTCPDGQVMTGIAGTTGSSFDQVQVVCGIPSVTSALAADVAAGATLPLRGNNVGTPVSSSCAANEIVVGFAGRAGALIDQLALRCAPLTAMFSGGTYTALLGTITPVTAVGGTGGTPFADTDCPPGEVAIGANIRAGDSIDGFGLVCGLPGITP